MANVFGSAWAWLQAVLEWFFPPDLLAEPLIALGLKVVFLVYGLWFLGLLIFKPIKMLYAFLSKTAKGK